MKNLPLHRDPIFLVVEPGWPEILEHDPEGFFGGAYLVEKFWFL